MKMTKLIQCFDRAMESEKKYVAVLIKMPGCGAPEIIINQTANFIDKLIYYKKAYNENCELNANKDIKILAVSCSDKFELIERWVRENESC